MIHARDDVEGLVRRLTQFAEERGDSVPSLADLGALWAFQDAIGAYADSLLVELQGVRSLMPVIDDLRLEKTV